MFKGWALVSLYRQPHNDKFHVNFCHYTGKPGRHGGHDYNMCLSGEISEDELRKTLRRRLTLERVDEFGNRKGEKVGNEDENGTRN